MWFATAQHSFSHKALAAFAAGVLALALAGSVPAATIANAVEANDAGTDAATDQAVTYTVSMRKSTDLATASICDTLFTRNADVELTSDGKANVTLYVADPVPNYASVGQSLKTVGVIYGNTTYPAVLHTDQKVAKPFSDDAMFFPKAGNYDATPITFTIPQEALADSVNGKVTCRAFVNMLKDEQDFLMVLQPKADDPGSQDPDPGTSDPEPGTNPKPSTKPSNGSKKTTKKSTKKSSSKTTTYTYTYNASFRKATSFGTISICDPLFASKADVVVSGNLAKITVYVVDPIPNYTSAGTPLSNVKFTYGGKTYAATYKSSSKVRKSFAASSMFIKKAGTYPATPITVTLPKGAVSASAKGGLMCQAYIKAVLGATQEFYVVLNGGKLISTKTTGTSELKKSSTTSRSSTGSSNTGTTATSSTTSTTNSTSTSTSNADLDDDSVEPDDGESSDLAEEVTDADDATSKAAASKTAAPKTITLSLNPPAGLWLLFGFAICIVIGTGTYANRKNRS